MRTRAVRDGDDYVVTGQKIWTSHAEVADYCELLVRTGPEDSRHRGISWLILPMDSPGVDIRPLHTIAGSTEFAELFLDEVRVPVANRVGEENDGWRVTMVTLSFERGTAFVGDLLEAVELLSTTVALARRTGAWADPGVRRQAGHLKAELDALWALTKRNVSQAARTGIPGVGGHLLQAGLLRDPPQAGRVLPRPCSTGPAWPPTTSRAPTASALLPAGTMVEDWLRGISLTIAAGTSQIQRNIVGERILGLPKEPQATAPGRGRAEDRGLRGHRVPVRAGRRHPPAVRGPVPARVDPLARGRPTGSSTAAGWQRARRGRRLPPLPGRGGRRRRARAGRGGPRLRGAGPVAGARARWSPPTWPPGWSTGPTTARWWSGLVERPAPGAVGTGVAAGRRRAPGRPRRPAGAVRRRRRAARPGGAWTPPRSPGPMDPLTPVWSVPGPARRRAGGRRRTWPPGGGATAPC